ncbi:hypothetical protein V6N13_017929 [Hibiscus sabdariffa]
MSRVFGMRERDGVAETLLLFASKRIEKGKGYFRIDWHSLNLETAEISEALSTMPPKARSGASAVALGNRVYLFGGDCVRMDPTCPDGKINSNRFHSHNYVFCFDCEHPDRGWKEAPSMLHPRLRPVSVAAKGKIYAFEGSRLAHFAEVFDVSGSGWKPLSIPPDLDMYTRRVSSPVLFDSPRSRIFVHFQTIGGPNPLYAYHVDGESWECLDEAFGAWSYATALVDGVLYYLTDPDEETAACLLSDQRCCLQAYDVVEKEWLPVKWLSKFSVWVPKRCGLYHLGKGHFCFAWHATLLDVFKYRKISVCKNSGEIHVTGVSESLHTVPFAADWCEFIALNEDQRITCEEGHKGIDGKRVDPVGVCSFEPADLH